MRCRHSLPSRRGAAIILVLVCLLALSSLVLGNQQIAFKGAFGARLLAEEYKADLMAESGLEAALTLLAEDDTIENDTQFERWSKDWGVDGVTISITPVNTKLNVNMALNSDRVQKALVEIVRKEKDARRLMLSLADWLDDDDEERYSGSEGRRYMRIWPPYTPRNGALKTLGELSLVAGWRDVVSKYNDVLTVYGDGRINLNYVGKDVFEAMFPEIVNSWKNIESWQDTRGFKSVADLREALPSLKNDDELYNDLLKSVTVESHVFEVRVVVDNPFVYEKRRYVVERSADQFKTEDPKVLGAFLDKVIYKDAM